jgi:hypothetical protein
VKPVDAITPSFFRHHFTTGEDPDAVAWMVTWPATVALFTGEVQEIVGNAARASDDGESTTATCVSAIASNANRIDNSNERGRIIMFANTNLASASGSSASIAQNGFC